MKAKSIFLAFAVVSFGGVVATVAAPVAGAQTEKSASVDKKVKVFIVSAKGGG